MRTAAILLTLGLALALSSSALADLPLAKQQAQRRYKEGMAAYRRGEFETARLALLQAYALDREAPNLLWDLAVTEAKSHHALDATEHFRDFLRSPSATERDRTRAQPYLDTAAKELGHIVVTAAPGASVTLDGSTLGALGDPVDVEPGAHVLEAHQGAQAKRVDVAPSAGETVQADLRIEELPPAPAPPPVAPPTPVPEPIREPAPLVPPEHATTSSSPTRVALTVAFGTGAAAALALGIVVRVNASAEADDAKSHVSGLPRGSCAGSSSFNCTAAHSAAEREASDKNSSTALFVGSGVLAAATVATWFLLAPDEHGSGPVAVPAVSPTSAGLAVRGSF